jgi:hypothetical protein
MKEKAISTKITVERKGLHDKQKLKEFTASTAEIKLYTQKSKILFLIET